MNTSSTAVFQAHVYKENSTLRFAPTYTVVSLKLGKCFVGNRIREGRGDGEGKYEAFIFWYDNIVLGNYVKRSSPVA